MQFHVKSLWLQEINRDEYKIPELVAKTRIHFRLEQSINSNKVVKETLFSTTSKHMYFCIGMGDDIFNLHERWVNI